MFGMGVLLAPKDFVEVARRPRSLGVGLAVQLLAVPGVAFAIGRLFEVKAGVAAGLVLVAAVPGGTMSNVFTHLARGNIALSIALTAVTTTGALVTTPLVLRVLVGEFLPADFEMPVGRVAWEIGVNLLVPLATGMLLGARMDSHWRGRVSQWAIRGSLAVIAVMIVGSTGSGRVDAALLGGTGVLAILILAGGCLLVATSSCRALGLTAPDRTAIVVEATLRNVNLAVLVKASLFPAVAGRVDPIGDGMFFTALMYGGIAFLFVAPPVVLARRRAAPDGPSLPSG